MSLQVPRDGLTQKLQRLSQTQQSIESVSSFCIFYHKDAKGVVQIWEQEFYKSPSDRKLALLYLANHILQEGRKKSMGFQEEYFKVLPKAVAHMAKHGDEKHKKALTRLVTVWEERRVFGTRHMKSFKEVLGLPSESKASAAAGGATAAGGNATTAAATATATAAVKMGPVGDALLLVQQKEADTTVKNQQFTSSWSQSLLTAAGLPEVTGAQSKLVALTAALQAELAARQAAMSTLSAELSRQAAEVNRVESQLQTVAGQKQQLDERLSALTQVAMASLGQIFQQNGAAVLGAAAPAAAGAAAAAAGDVDGAAGGSPQAPGLELEEDDDDDDEPGPSFQASTAAAAAGGSLGLQSNPMQQQQPSQIVTHDLQALLAHPEMLSAAIQSAQGGTAVAGMQPVPLMSGPPVPPGPPAPPVPPSMAFSGPPQAMVLQMGPPSADGGVQLQLPTGPIPGTMPPGADAFTFAPHVQPAAYGGDGGGLGMKGGYMMAQQQGGYGGLAALQQQQSGFADEADDPYDPEHAD